VSELLVKAIQDEDGEVCEVASHSLLKIGGSLAVPSLIEALKLANEYVRQEIIKTLGDLRDRSAIPALINIKILIKIRCKGIDFITHQLQVFRHHRNPS
jgi:HEAT repeat protein